MDNAAAAVDPHQAKAQILDYCRRKGALVAGVANLDTLQRIAPPGHRPRDLMPRARSVISLGVGGQTRGAWSVPSRALSFFGSTEGSAYKVAFGCAFFIESRFGRPSIYCPPDVDPEGGTRIPFQSMKLHAEVAGLGARSPKVKLPERLEIIGAMPMTPTRKIIKARLRERLLGGASPSPVRREGESR